MSQSNFTLNILNITDTNIQVNNSRDECIVFKGVRKQVKIIDAVLTYSLSKCPQCGYDTLIKNGKRLAKVRLASFNGWEYQLHLMKQRYLCKSCGATCGAHSPLLISNHTMSNQIAPGVFRLAKQSLSVKAISDLLGVSSSTVSRILYNDENKVTRTRRLPENLCFDEFRSVKNTFSFIACDAEKHSLLTMLPDRLSKTIVDYFVVHYSLSERQAVKSVSIDLNANYQSVVKRIFPNARIIVDRFHIVQLVGRALDNIRTSILSGMDDKKSRPYKAMKSYWRLYHLPEAEVNATKPQYWLGINEYMTTQNLIDLGLDKYPKFKQVYQTYQAIQRALSQRNPKLLREALKNYRPTHTAMDTAITTLKKNITYVVNSCELPFSNGPLEGLIRKIKTLKRNCYGFSDLDHFFIRINLITA